MARARISELLARNTPLDDRLRSTLPLLLETNDLRGARRAGVVLLDHEHDQPRLAATAGEPVADPDDAASSVLRRAIAADHPPPAATPGESLVIPLKAAGSWLGAIFIDKPPASEDPDSRRDVLQSFAETLAQAVARERQQQRVVDARIQAIEAARLVDTQRAELQAIIDAIPSGVFLKDDHNNIINLNKAAAEMLGRPQSELRGRNIAEFIPAHHAESQLDIDRQALRSGMPAIGLQDTFATPDAEPIHIRADVVPIDTPAPTAGNRVVAVFTDISELVEARKSLDQLAARMTVAARGADVGVWELNLRTEELVWDDTMFRLYGLSPGDAPPTFHLWRSCVHEDDLPSTLRALDAARDDRAPFSVDFRVILRSGETRHIRAHATLTRDEHGNPDRLVGVNWDVTDITRARQALEQTEERLSLAIKASGIGLWDWNIPTSEIYFSDTFYTLLGYEPGELPMSLDTWKELCHPDDADAARADIHRHFDGETDLYVNEHRLRAKDGSWIWIRDVGEVVERDERGGPKRMTGVHVDIDALMRTQREIASLEENLRLFIRHTPAAVAMFDRDLRYIVASEGWFEQYNLNHEDIVGRSHYDVFPSIPDRWKDIHKRVLEGHPLSAERDYFIRENGVEQWIRWELRPWRDSSGDVGGLVMFTEVITDQIHHERTLETARRAAEAASTAKSEFLANMSHEIRTPMTAILGFTDLLLEPDLASDERVEHVATIRNNAAHLLEIINNILDMSKIEAGRMTTERVRISPARVIQDVASLSSTRADNKDIKLCVDFQTPVPAGIHTDPTKLRQILVNLVGNAVKFTDQGAVELRVRYDEDDRRLDIAVADSGIGMSPEQLEAVGRFEAFTQADSSTTRRFGGTGLGLRISNSLAKLLGGRIEIDSTEGQGSVFTLSLDIPEEDAAELIEPHDARAIFTSDERCEPCGATDRRLEGVHVLLAEDGPDNQRLITTLLKKAGARVTLAPDGRVAAEHVEAAEDPPDLILMDMQMPVLDGYAATARIRKISDVPVVALTAHAMEGDRERCLEAGCDDYLAKPIDREAIVVTCARWAAARAA